MVQTKKSVEKQIDKIKSDYKYIREARQSGKVLYSYKGLIFPLECDSEKCHKISSKVCCRNHKGGFGPVYDDEMIESLPEKIKKFVNPNGTVKHEPNGDCSLIPFCKPSIRPLTCLLYPLGFNKKGRLIIKRSAWTRCPLYDKSKKVRIIDTMGDTIKEALGGKCYQYLKSEIERIDNESI